MQQKIARKEDRRSCHNVSLLLGLAVAAKHPDAGVLFAHMILVAAPVAGQAAN